MACVILFRSPEHVPFSQLIGWDPAAIVRAAGRSGASVGAGAIRSASPPLLLLLKFATKERERVAIFLPSLSRTRVVLAAGPGCTWYAVHHQVWLNPNSRHVYVIDDSYFFSCCRIDYCSKAHSSAHLNLVFPFPCRRLIINKQNQSRIIKQLEKVFLSRPGRSTCRAIIDP